jgi:hypothetical protein
MREQCQSKQPIHPNINFKENFARLFNEQGINKSIKNKIAPAK